MSAQHGRLRQGISHQIYLVRDLRRAPLQTSRGPPRAFSLNPKIQATLGQLPSDKLTSSQKGPLSVGVFLKKDPDSGSMVDWLRVNSMGAVSPCKRGILW